MSDTTPDAMAIVPLEPEELEAAEHEQCGVRVLKCKPDVRADVDDEAGEICWSSAHGVGKIAYEGGCQALKDHVRGEGQVDKSVLTL